ncbi:hypothetical protein GWI33_000251 [Rhynchophorus ferrugineus]|uniref:Malate dehydrogenase, mitochondrial n=1 Tax=Rhynchophorus ferrugineus TaxID=354439 RepID=A0A834IVA9_RHYFE|nr:hypothetical protein GWI33_000251 [Rhynchophorus ferrugineus]
MNKGLYNTDCSQGNKKGYTVTILDGCHRIGRHTALLLKQCPHITELRLYDQDSSICCVAEDLSHIDTKTKVKSFCGLSVLKNAVMDSDLVITLGGCKMKCNESVPQLFERNVDSVRAATLHCIEFCPKTIFCIAKPPIEAFVPLASEEYKRAGVYDHRKIIGVSSMACMRSNYFIGLISGQNVAEIRCPVVGGLSKNCLVACVSQSRPEGVHPQHHKLIQDSIIISEDEVLKAYGDRSAPCLASALAISRFVNSQLKAMTGETNCVDCAFVKQTGHIGQFLPYMTSIVRLGRHGIMSSHMPNINGYEAHCLKKAALFIKEYIKLGEEFVKGEQKTIKAIKETAPKKVKCN